MAFRLKRDESIRHGLRRVLRKELTAAITSLEAHHVSDEGVHAARKHIKKVRAILHLVKRDVRIGAALKYARHAARLLSPLRDAGALKEEAMQLRASGALSLSTGARRTVSQRLTRHKERSRDASKRHHVVAHAIVLLIRVRRAVHRWPWSEVGSRTLSAGVKRGYKRARRGMKRARATHDGDVFHAWRKRVKLLWYLLRLMKSERPTLRPRISRLRRIETWLGRDHNLFVLQAKVQNALSAKDRARFRQMVNARQRQLRRRALELGATVLDAHA